MAISPKFILKSPKAEKETSLKFYFYLDNSRFTYSLGPDKKIHPSLWNTKKMRPFKLKGVALKNHKKVNPNIEIELKNLNSRIENIIVHTSKFISNAEIQGEKIEFDELKSYLDTSFGVEKKAPVNQSFDSLEDYLDKYIKGMKDGTRLITSNTGQGRRYRKGTIKAYQVLKTKLQAYRKTKRKRYLKFSDIDMDFYNDFQQYIYSFGFTPNYFGNFIKNLKAIMKLSLDERFHSNIEFTKKSFKKTSNTTVSIYLTEKELNKIYNHQFQEDSNLEKYRDIFLIGCWTAQRFSDFSNISNDQIKEKDGYKVLELNQIKSDAKVIVPLRSEVIRLLDKYSYNIPKVSQQKMNDALKLIGKLLDINEPIEVKKTKGGKEVFITMPKYELISTHTARRTGCTLMYLNDIPTQDIMKISGHKSESQLLKYIKVSKEETAKRLSMNSFFRGSNLKIQA